MAFTWPTDCDSPRKKIEYCTRAIEKLRQIHNKMGAWRRTGITQAEYDALPLKVRNRYAYYAGPLSNTDWNDFVAIFQKYVQAAHEHRNKQFVILEAVAQWDPDPTDFDIAP